MATGRVHLTQARHAGELLGVRIRQGRIERRWTMDDLAERAGISTVTLRKVERGDLTVGLGVALDCAVLAGVALFVEDPARLPRLLDDARERGALLPRRVRGGDGPVEDDF